MHYDLTIIGGGMVGVSLALALQKKALRIALVDAQPQVVADPRLIALNDNSCRLLKNLQVWPLLAEYAEPIRAVHVSQRGHFGMAQLTAEQIGLSELGHVVPAAILNKVLYEVLVSSTISVLKPARLKAISCEDARAQLSIEHNNCEETLTSRWVIGADGTHSSLRELLHFETESIDYQQSALVTVTELQRSHRHIAYERFHTQGAIAMLPLTGQRCATIWTDTNDTITELKKLSDTEFLNQLQQHVGYRLGKLKKINERFYFPLMLQRVNHPLQKNCLLLGNAAHTLSPIAAQGLNVALYEIAVFAEQFTAAESFDAEQFIASIESTINSSQHLSHGLTRLFSNDFFILSQLRSLGLLGLEMSAFAKKYFSHRVMGKATRLPELMII